MPEVFAGGEDQDAMMPRLLFADDAGRVYDHPVLLAPAQSGDDLLAPAERPVPLPPHARLMALPGRLPVGLDPHTGAPVLVSEVRIGRRTIRPRAVAAVLPPGWTRTLLPAYVPDDPPAGRPVLPQWAYTAAAWDRSGFATWAIHTDLRRHWDPAAHSTADLPARVEARLKEDPENSVLRQLRTCALEYGCFTAQNIFYGRDEGAIPASKACNARCVGCISDQEPESGAPPSHFRILQGPTPEEMARVGAAHLDTARGRAMVSFGQGCEGEPLTRVSSVLAAVRLIRARTRRGSVHLNTNGSRPEALARLVEAGVDSVRISLNSAADDLYAAYYRPVGYSFAHVRESVRVAAAAGAYVALNLLTFPGVTDREGEVERLEELCALGVRQVQTRPLAMDPAQYLEVARNKGAGGEAMGIRAMIARLKRRFPGLWIGNFSRARGERAPRAAGARRPRRGS